MAYVNGKKIPGSLYMSGSTRGDYDLVITSDEQFSQCLYPLFKNEESLTQATAANKVSDPTAFNAPSQDFKARRVLVKGVTFKQTRGYDDIRLHIFQPSITYIHFEDCRWETTWRVSGQAPTTLSPVSTEFTRAPGDFNLVIDGIVVTEDNIRAAKEKGEHWYIGLRNIKALINSDVQYPDDYDIKDGWDFKMTCQYFDYASNSKIPGFWDGTNISDCYVIERIKRCVNCVNISASPVLNAGEPKPVAVQECVTISNFNGNFTYEKCESIDYYTCEGIEDRYKPYDYIVRSMSELNNVLAQSIAGRRILLRDFTINTTDKLDFKWAAFVGFSNMLFASQIVIANVWEIDGAGLDASNNNKHTVEIIGDNRTRVYNIGRVITSPSESEYYYKNCMAVHSCIVTVATGCQSIHSCYVSRNTDVTLTQCTDISGLNVMSSSRTANMTFNLCSNISNITHNGTGTLTFVGCRNISNVVDFAGAQVVFDTCVQLSNINRRTANTTITYNNCGSVDFLTCSMSQGTIPSKYLESYAPLVNGKVPTENLPSYSYDLVITSEEQFLAEQANFYGKKILVKDAKFKLRTIDFNHAACIEFCNVFVGNEVYEVTIKNFDIANFAGLQIGWRDENDESYSCDNLYIEDFAFVENLMPIDAYNIHGNGNMFEYANGYGIVNCLISSATNCCNIMNCHVVGRNECIFTSCNSIANLHSKDFWGYGVCFNNCTHLSNIALPDVNVTYNNCSKVSADTCDGYNG